MQRAEQSRKRQIEPGVRRARLNDLRQVGHSPNIGPVPEPFNRVPAGPCAALARTGLRAARRGGG
jgi:hypothetical protein